MCKYCKLKLMKNGDDECDNDAPTILKINDGSHEMRLTFYRYKRDNESPSESTLVMDLSAKILGSDSMYPIKEKAIKIKYCPFCGEEL